MNTIESGEYTIPTGMDAIIRDGKIIVMEKESEDEKIRKELFFFLREINETKGVPTRFFVWLEKHKEQKPAEWSEEDNINLNACMQIINDAWEIAQIKELGTTKFAPHYYGDLIDWLKSLRHSWKPSEEQMEALKHCVDGWPDRADGILDSLYNDLKTL